MISGSPPVIDIELLLPLPAPPVPPAVPGVVAAAAVSRATSPPAVAVFALSPLFASPLRPPHAPTATSDAQATTADSRCHPLPTILPPAPEVACVPLHSARHLRERQ